MYHDLPRAARFWSVLFAIDQDLAEETRKKACPCGGRLHCANYLRKPRGTPVQLPERLCLRLSFCCDRDGCRKRVTPPSVRFLGPKVYLGAIVILISAMRQGPTPRRVRELSTRFGADRRTIARWQVFWREHFPQTPSGRAHAPAWCPSSRSSPCRTPSSRPSSPAITPAEAGHSCSAFSHRSRSPEPCGSRSRDGLLSPAEDARRLPGTARVTEVVTVPSPGFRGDVMTHTCPESTGARWARFRFSVIGSLLSSPLRAERSRARSALLRRRPGRIP